MKKILNAVLILTAVVMLLSTAALGVAGAYLSRYKETRVDPSLLEISTDGGESVLYYFVEDDSDPEVYSTLSSGAKYKHVAYGDLPDDLKNAFVAVEDKNFYRHNGVDFLRSAEAAVNHIFGYTSGFGASTITQQLVKNLTGNDEVTVERKIGEIFSALDLERRCDKTEIIELYLNIINLSDGCRGVGAAAEHYFSKEVGELSLCEAACLAAITNNPSKYNPKTHPENNKYRREIILRCMRTQGYITEREYREACEGELILNVSSKDSERINSWYTDMVFEDVLRDLCSEYDISRSVASGMLYTGGLRIYTTLDPEIQGIVEKYYSDASNFPSDPSKEYTPQSAMIITDPYTGDILGVAGAVGKKDANRVQNYATDTLRPPGSAIKPLSVYAPAIEKGIIDWSSVVDDSPTIISENRSWPKNASGEYLGEVTLPYAVEHSLNTVAVRVLGEIGLRESFDFLRDIGINSLVSPSEDDAGDCGEAALALGQPNKGITLRELVGAYSILEEGIYSKPRSYLKVTDTHGRIILENSAEKKVMISAENAAIMTKLLEGVVDIGTAHGKVTLDGRVEVAGKTGTTQDNCDRLFVGYTPQLCAGIWFGYDYPEPLDGVGGNPSIYIWDDIMSLIYEKCPDKYSKASFDIPDGVCRLTYNKKTGDMPRPIDNADDLAEGWFAN